MKSYMLGKALKLTTPVFFGYLAIGIGFGFLFSDAGYPWWLCLASSLLMYTGSGQYFIVAQLAAHASIAEILLAQALLGIRHAFYSLALISKYKDAGLKKPYLIFAITDETFALVQSAAPPPRADRTAFYTLVSALDQSYWCLGSLVGALAYAVMARYNLSRYLEGVDFALTSLFIVILIEQLRATRDVMPAAVGGAAALLCVVLYRCGVFPSSNIIWLSICAGLAVLLLIRGPAFFKDAAVLDKREEP